MALPLHLWIALTLLAPTLILCMEFGPGHQFDNFDINKLLASGVDPDQNLNEFMTNSFQFEESYFQFYNWLAQLAKRRIKINKIVDAILEQFRKEIVERNGHIFPLPNLDLQIEGSKLPISAFIRNWDVSGGHMLYRNGEATLKIDPRTLNILINIPLGIYNGTNEDGELDLNLFGGTITADFRGDLQGSTYDFEFTIYSTLKWPSITKFKFLNRGLVIGEFQGWEEATNWALAIFILLGIVVVIFLILCFLTCYFVFRIRKMSKLLVDKKN